MKKMLSIFAITLALSTALLSCKKDESTDTLMTKHSPSIIRESEDMGQEYIDSIIFVGESTTYHMKNREVLSGGKNTKQIWSPKGGTMTLDLSSKDVRIVYPENGREMTVAEAASLSQPRIMIFTFGLNGAVQDIKLGKEYFKRCYLSLISSVRQASPKTRIILQSAFPVAGNMDMTNYTVSAKTLNEYILEINMWTLELCEEEGLGFLATFDILTDSSGMLKTEYQSGDGYHLTADAYRAILGYIRTHGCY